MRVLLLALAAVLTAGLVKFALAKPPIEVRFPRAARESAARRNLAHFTEGPTVRASSVLWAARHHPGYLVDGWQHPVLLAKWVSAPGDAAPWAEVQFDRAREVDEVALELASAHERLPPEPRYRIECFAGATLVASLPVEANSAARPRHALRCPATDRVRVTFAPADMVRLYELEAWGK